MRPLTVEIIAYAPTEFFHCLHCEVVFQQVGIGQKIHAEQRAANFPDDLKKEFADLSAWVEQTAERHPDQIQFKIVDAASIEGVYKSLRYGVRKFPAVIVAGRDKVSGGDLEGASTLVDRHLAASSTA
ncbi:MAG TPA: DUF1525 domain-containing protein [Chloroflexota bacterium]|nr:DUF1525 domain-containing protein [Chloroflexota bacterium]